MRSQYMEDLGTFRYYREGENIENFECFLFKMMCQTATGSFRDTLNDSVYEPERRRNPWRIIRRKLLHSRFIPTGGHFLAELLFQQRNQIVKNLEKILKVTLTIETHKYQKDIKIRQLIFETVKRTGEKARNFFRVFADSTNTNLQLMEILSISPEHLKSFCKIL